MEKCLDIESSERKEKIINRGEREKSGKEE